MNLGVKMSSRSDEAKVAVGFNPRFAEQTVLSVAERRLNTAVLRGPSGVAPRRGTVPSTVSRGLKPAATIAASLREARRFMVPMRAEHQSIRVHSWFSTA
jgi:hypothetical protein